MRAEASLVALSRSPATAVSGESASPVHLRIVPPERDHALCFCWVDADGRLPSSHLRTLGECVQCEYTYVGHTFALFDACEAHCAGVDDLTDALYVHVEQAPNNGREIELVLSAAERPPAPVRPSRMHAEVLTRVARRACGEYRVIVRCPGAWHRPPHPPLPEQRELPPPGTDWCVSYTFACPPAPARAAFDTCQDVLYVWGDLSFGAYSRGQPFALHGCSSNQIVPQVTVRQHRRPDARPPPRGAGA